MAHRTYRIELPIGFNPQKICMARLIGIDETTFPDDPRKSFRIFVNSSDNDNAGLKSVINHYRNTISREPGDNILRLHYVDMTADLLSSMYAIATHIGISHPADIMTQLEKAARFENMQANADRFGLAAGKRFWKNDSGFFDSATSNKWEGVLTPDDLAAYDKVISTLLSPDERHWLEWGSKRVC